METNDTNYIAECLVNELSIMIETISPGKLVQCNKHYAPWIDNNFVTQSQLRDKFHKIAVSTNNQGTYIEDRGTL